MNRTLALAVIAGCALGTHLAGNQARAEEKAAAKRAGLVHTVIFYLKKDAPPGSADAVIAEARELLARIPSVRSLKVGRRVEQSQGPANNKDFQVGLLVLFDDYEGLQAYIVDPKHKEFVRRLQSKNIEEKVSVFDFEDDGKPQP